MSQRNRQRVIENIQYSLVPSAITSPPVPPHTDKDMHTKRHAQTRTDRDIGTNK